jgi:hypothetical protein
VPVGGPRGGSEARKKQSKKQEEAFASECKCNNQVRLRERDDTLLIPISLPFPSAVELSGAELSPTQRGWTFCPVRAHPFWIKREACPLHDLE